MGYIGFRCSQVMTGEVWHFNYYMCIPRTHRILDYEMSFIGSEEVSKKKINNPQSNNFELSLNLESESWLSKLD